MVLRAYIDQLASFKEDDLWIDETFNKKLEQVSAKNAFISPLPGYNSVAQVIAHLTAWRLSTLSILNGGKKTVMMDSPANWPANKELEEKGWDAMKNEFYESQQQLIDLLHTKNDSFLQQEAAHSGKSMEYYIQGLIHHDMYHLGQIGLIIKMIAHQTVGAKRINQLFNIHQ